MRVGYQLSGLRHFRDMAHLTASAIHTSGIQVSAKKPVGNGFGSVHPHMDQTPYVQVHRLRIPGPRGAKKKKKEKEKHPSPDGGREHAFAPSHARHRSAEMMRGAERLSKTITPDRRKLRWGPPRPDRRVRSSHLQLWSLISAICKIMVCPQYLLLMVQQITPSIDG